MNNNCGAMHHLCWLALNFMVGYGIHSVPLSDSLGGGSPIGLTGGWNSKSCRRPYEI